MKTCQFFFSLQFFLPAVLQPAVVGMLLEYVLFAMLDWRILGDVNLILSFYLAVYFFTSRYFLFEKCTTEAVRSEDPIPVTLTAFREIRQLQ